MRLPLYNIHYTRNNIYLSLYTHNIRIDKLLVLRPAAAKRLSTHSVITFLHNIIQDDIFNRLYMCTRRLFDWFL